jgi:hypothetical protein
MKTDHIQLRGRQAQQFLIAYLPNLRQVLKRRVGAVSVYTQKTPKNREREVIQIHIHFKISLRPPLTGRAGAIVAAAEIEAHAAKKRSRGEEE